MNKYIDYSNQIVDFYKNYNINISISSVVDSYSITRYFLKLDRTNKTKISNIEKLVDDLSSEISVKNIKFTLDFQTGGIVLEIPKKDRELLNYTFNKTQNTNGLTVNFGKDLNNNDFLVDLTTLPHLLVAGTTGSGKSIFINTVLLNLIQTYNKDYLNISLIDPKKVELNLYKDIEQCEAFADNLENAKKILCDTLIEIDKRYTLLQENHVRKIEEYNNIKDKRIPYKLVIIDELADIILQDNKNMINKLYMREHPDELSLESLIVRIAQIGRAAGVHLIVATQRPSSDIITGLIKANIPSRVSFSVATAIDSRVILDIKGAEKLTGKGDMLVKIVGDNELHRVQGAFVEDETVQEITNKYIVKDTHKVKTLNKEELQKDLKKQQALINDYNYKITETKTKPTNPTNNKTKKKNKRASNTEIVASFIKMIITIIVCAIIWSIISFNDKLADNAIAERKAANNVTSTSNAITQNVENNAELQNYINYINKIAENALNN